MIPRPRAEDWPTEDVKDLTVRRCEQEIDALTSDIVCCHCTCPQRLLDIQRWKQRRLDLLTPR